MEKYTMEIPVPIGSTVYCVTPCRCGAAYAERCQTRERNRTTVKQTSVYKQEISREDGRNGAVKCIKVFARPFDPMKHLHMYGKSVFPTLEEATTHKKVVKK